MTQFLEGVERRIESWIRRSRRLPELPAAAAILFGFAFLVFGRALLRPGLMISGSDFLQFFFWEAFTRAELAAGQLPLWNPFFFAGYPAAANPQTLLFYPPAMVLRWLPLSYAFGAGIWLHMGWAGLGMSWLSRRQGLSRAAGLAAGTAFMMSGVYVTHIQGGHLEWLYTLAWLPWVIGSWQGLLEGGGWKGVRLSGLAGLATALMVLGGALRVIACAGVMILILGLFWAVEVLRSRPVREVWRRLAWAGAQTCLAGALAFGLAAPQLLPALELAVRSSRAVGLSIDCTTQFSLTLTDLASLGLPRLPEAPFLEWERTAYVGALGVILALVGAGAGRMAKWKWLLLAWGTAGFVLGVGPALPVYPAARALIPFLDLIRQPFTFVVMISFAAAGLAGVGWDACTAWFAKDVAAVGGETGHGEAPSSETPHRGVFTGVWLGLGLLAAGVVSDVLLYQMHPSSTDSSFFGRLSWLAGFSAPRYLAALIGVWCLTRLPFRRLAAGLAVGALLADLWLFCYARVPILAAASPAERAAYVPQIDPAAARVLTEPYMFSDQSMAVGVANAQGYAPIVVASYDAFVTGLKAREACPSFEHANIDTGDGQLLRRLSVTQVIQPRGEARIIEFTGPRVWWTAQASGAATAEEAIRQARAPGFDFYGAVVIEGGAGSGGRGSGAARITDYATQRVVLEVEADGPGWAVLNDVWYPGWEATVDGQAAPVYRADGTFRAVPVPAGRSIVAMRFQSTYLNPGLGMAVAAVIGVLASLMAGRRDDRLATRRLPHWDN